MGFNPLQSLENHLINKEAVKDNSGLLTDGPGPIDSLMHGVLGIDPSRIQSVRDDVRNRTDQKRLGPALEALGGYASSDMSGPEILAEIDKRRTERETLNFQRSLAPLTMQMANDREQRKSDTQLSLATLTEQGRQADNRLNATLQDSAAKRALQAELAFLQRSDNRDDRTLTRSENRLDRRFRQQQADADRALQLEITQADQAHRDNVLAYERERASKQDKQKMIAQLMSGLGQLGGVMSIAI